MALPKGDRAAAARKRKENRRKMVGKKTKPREPVHNRASFLVDQNIFTASTIKARGAVNKKRAASKRAKKVK